MTRRHTDAIIVHCADTPSTMDIGAAEIRQWHTDRGWSDIGYHFVVRRDGTVETGRAIDAVGAHVKGFNQVSLGVCLVGGWKGNFNFTKVQMDALSELLESLKVAYPKAVVKGHRDYDNCKECPSFDVQEWWGE